MIISLYTSRVILKTLGVDDFGIYNIVGSVIILFSFLQTSMTSATQRFLTFELGKSEKKEFNKVFSTSVNAHLAIIILVVLLAETVGLWFFNHKVNIPPDRMATANWIYQFTLISFCFQTIQTPYTASIIAYERMSIFAFVSIFEALFNLAIVFILVLIPGDKLFFFGLLTIGVSVSVFMTYKIICNIKLEGCNYRPVWDKPLFYKLMSFSGWSLFGQLSLVSATQGVGILLNIFYSVAVNAAMGVALQVNKAISAFVYSFQTAFKPQITKSYASNNFEHLHELIFQSSKFSFFLLFILAVPVISSMEMLLGWWLEEVPRYAVEFSSLIIVATLIDTLGGPLWIAIFATGNIKKYQITISCILLSDLLFSYLFLKLGASPPTVLLVKIFVYLTVFIVRIVYTSKVCDFSPKLFAKRVLLPVVFVTILSIPIPILTNSCITNFTELIAFSFLYVVIIILIIFAIGLNKNERNFILVKIKSLKGQPNQNN